ncbi:MAG: N-6 DNA methylase [Chloroflexi bacterium]|nr:N-6 DNA methylase [Chloroflexota bacterium]
MPHSRLANVTQAEAALAEETGGPLLSISYTPDGQRLIDFLSENTFLQDTPEERRRQEYLRVLHYEYRYPKEQIRREVAINIGSNQRVYADIVVYRSVAAAQANDQGQIRFCVEVKPEYETAGHNQLVSYVFFTSAEGAVWTNGVATRYYRRLDSPEKRLEPSNGIPRPTETWDKIGVLSKEGLTKPKDVKRLLRICHQKLFRSGIESEDLAMDMVRIILAKWRDEILPDPLPRFYCTAEEYRTPHGRDAVARRVQELFAEVREQNPEVFEFGEDITAPPDHIAEVVNELQSSRLLVDEDAWWDILGAAYEQYTASHFRQTNGQFFTNRLVVHMMVEMAKPSIDDVILDPAGGSGGFITAVLRHIRRELIRNHLSETARHQLFDQVRRSVGLIEKAPRLVKVAKTAAILTGDGHDNFYPGDSLRPLTDTWFNAGFLTRFGEERPSIILTNPPYAGTSEGKITDPDILQQFDVAKIWQSGMPTSVLIPGGTPPELLFLERCFRWLRPGGRMGIVMARGMLDTQTSLAARTFLLENAHIHAVVNLHKDTFQPYTGVRTSVLFVEKPIGGRPPRDYPIFMAMSRKIGQDSEGVPVFRVDDNGHETEDLDHDLDYILNKYEEFLVGIMPSSEFVFKVQKSQLDDDSKNMNPQHYLPAYHDSIGKVIEIGEQDGWTIKTIGNIAPVVFKGSWFQRQNLETETRDSPGIEPFFTPTALFQIGKEHVKHLDLNRATKEQRGHIEASRAQQGEILVTRSGTIGRVLYVTENLHGQLISDDLIHIRIEDLNLRHYVYLMLKHELGQHQMLRNEYGTVQQHLEPRHVRDIVVPVPEDDAIVGMMARDMMQSITARETSAYREDRAFDVLGRLFESPGLVVDSRMEDFEREEWPTGKNYFDRLVSEWEHDRPKGVDLHEMVMHPAYQRIVGMGVQAVPWLLERLERQPGHWFVALGTITGADPVPTESQGKIDEMAAAWLEWGRRLGYLRRPHVD